MQKIQPMPADIAHRIRRAATTNLHESNWDAASMQLIADLGHQAFCASVESIRIAVNAAPNPTHVLSAFFVAIEHWRALAISLEQDPPPPCPACSAKCSSRPVRPSAPPLLSYSTYPPSPPRQLTPAPQ